MNPFRGIGHRRWFAALLPMLGIALFAKAHADSGEWAALAERSQRQIEKEPRDEAAWGDLIRGWLGEEDFKRAESALAAWRSKVANPSPVIDSLQGEVAYSQGNIPGAIEAWRRYVAAAPNDVKGWTSLAQAYEKQSDFPAAIDSLGQACKVAPTASRYAARARLKARVHDWKGALADVEEGNRLDASDNEIVALYPIFERRKQWLPQVEKLDAALARNPSDRNLLLSRAEILVNEGFEDAARDDVEAAYKLDPTSLRARLLKGAFAWNQRSREQAGRVMAIEGKWPTPDVMQYLARLDEERDPEIRAAFLVEIKQPLLALDEVAALDGSIAAAEAFLMLQKLPETGAAARRAAKKHPDDPRSWLVLGRLEMENGNMAEAINAFDRSLKLKRTPEAKKLRDEAKRRQDR